MPCHPSGHIVVRRARIDPQTQTRKIHAAKMGNDRFQTVMPSGGAFQTKSHTSQRQVDIVYNYENILRLDLVETYDFPNGYATVVHIRIGFEKHDPFAADI